MTHKYMLVIDKMSPSFRQHFIDIRTIDKGTSICVDYEPFEAEDCSKFEKALKAIVHRHQLRLLGIETGKI